MLSRKFTIERTDDALTIRSVKSGLTGWEMVGLVSVAMTLLAVTSVFKVAAQFMRRDYPLLEGALALELLCIMALLTYQGSFGAQSCVLDRQNDQVWIQGFKRAKLSHVTAARMDGSFLSRTLGKVNHLSLEMETGPPIPIFFLGASRGANGIAEDLAAEVNSFLKECAAVRRKDRSAIWSWGEAKSTG